MDELLRNRPVSEGWRRLMLERLDAVAVIYRLVQGRTADRTAFAKRLWRLRVGYRPSAVLMLAPDEVRLRHARRLLAAAPFPAYLALESAAAGAAAPIWRTPSGAAVMGLQTALEHTGPRAAWPVEEPLARAALPAPRREDGGYDWTLPRVAQAHGEAGPGPALRLTLAGSRPPGDAAGRETLPAVPGDPPAGRPGVDGDRRRPGPAPTGVVR